MFTNTQVKDAPPSVANLVLTGHSDNAEFALATCLTEPYVASGGKDTHVCVWNLQDSVSSLAALTGAAVAEAPTLEAQSVLKGHTDVVEDVCFAPHGHHELASVGDDHQLLLWDTRTGTAPTTTVPKAHGESDLHTVDWNRQQPLHLATGAADGSVKVWDARATSEPLFSFEFHNGAVMHVEWCPHHGHVLASGAEDCVVALWDLARDVSANPKSPLPPQLFFQHRGHRAQVVDFQWETHDPWTLVSVSDDVGNEGGGGGGTVQVWRVSDLLTRERAEVSVELDAHRCVGVAPVEVRCGCNVLRRREYIVNGRSNGVAEEGAAPMAEVDDAAAPVAPGCAGEESWFGVVLTLLIITG